MFVELVNVSLGFPGASLPQGKSTSLGVRQAFPKNIFLDLGGQPKFQGVCSECWAYISMVCLLCLWVSLQILFIAFIGYT